MNPYQELVAEFARLSRPDPKYPLGGFPPLPCPPLAPDAPKVLIFSPHPDDEVIVGGLALRLRREAAWRVINVAVTQGSNAARQAERLEELKRCCDCLGFDVVQTAPSGLEKVNVKTREQQPALWSQSVAVIARLLREQQPQVIFLPHEGDWNSTHIGTHFLVADALKTMPPEFSCYTVETEYWQAMTDPNLMVELSAQHVVDLVTALSCHVGEVRRNPYHLSLPAWMLDNVRRGSELVGGQGAAAPDYTFATLYRRRRWRQGRWEPTFADATARQGGGTGGQGDLVTGRPGAERFLGCAGQVAGLFQR